MIARARADCGFPWPLSRCTSRIRLFHSGTKAADGTVRSSNGSTRSRLCFKNTMVKLPRSAIGLGDIVHRAQTGRRGGAGPVGDLLGGETPPAALLSAQPFFRPADGSRDHDDFPAGPCHQAGEDTDVDVGFQEMHGAVGEDRVGTAGVKAVDL